MFEFSFFCRHHHQDSSSSYIILCCCWRENIENIKIQTAPHHTTTSFCREVCFPSTRSEKLESSQFTIHIVSLSHTLCSIPAGGFKFLFFCGLVLLSLHIEKKSVKFSFKWMIAQATVERISSRLVSSSRCWMFMMKMWCEWSCCCCGMRELCAVGGKVSVRSEWERCYCDDDESDKNPRLLISAFPTSSSSPSTLFTLDNGAVLGTINDDDSLLEVSSFDWNRDRYSGEFDFKDIFFVVLIFQIISNYEDFTPRL